MAEWYGNKDRAQAVLWELAEPCTNYTLSIQLIIRTSQSMIIRTNICTKEKTNRVHTSPFTMSTSPYIVIIALSLAWPNDMEIKIEPKRCCENWPNPASTIQNKREKGKYFWIFKFWEQREANKELKEIFLDFQISKKRTKGRNWKRKKREKQTQRENLNKGKCFWVFEFWKTKTTATN